MPSSCGLLVHLLDEGVHARRRRSGPELQRHRWRSAEGARREVARRSARRPSSPRRSVPTSSAALADTVTGCSGRHPTRGRGWPVMIFVVDAIGLRACAFRSYSTLPVAMVSTIAAGDVMLGAAPPKSPRSEPLTSKLSVCECGRGGVETGDTWWCAQRTLRQDARPTTASTTTNKRSGRSRPRLVVETLIAASIAYTSGLTASDWGGADHRRGDAPGLETPGPQAVVDLLSAGAGHHQHAGLSGRLQRGRRGPAVAHVLRDQLRALDVRARPFL